MSDNNYKKIEFLFILLIVMIGVYYIYLASNTQMLGEDEGGYLNLGRQFLNLEYKSDPYVVFPFTPLTYVPFFYIFGYSLGVAKAVTALFGILTMLLIYLFCKKIDKTSFYGINAFGLASISILLTVMYFTHFMLIAYTEITMAFFSILIAYILLGLKNLKTALLAGAVIGLAFYAKSTTPLIFPLSLFLFAVSWYLIKKDKHFLKLAIIACLVSGAIMMPFLIRNITLFNYPYTEGLNSFFKSQMAPPTWLTPEIMKSLSVSVNAFDVFGYIAVFLCIFGIVYSLQERNEKMLFVPFEFLLFIFIFIIRGLLGSGISDPRYFSIIFPEIALIGGYYISKASNLKKYLPLFIIVFFIFAIYSSMSVALSTEQSQRYPSDYIDAMKWIKQNTPQDAIIFTAYGGSLSYYGERKNLWTSLNEFPDLMHSTNSTYIYDILKKNNVSYILVWNGVLSNDWIIPQSNIIGVFTYNFVNQVSNDNKNFNVTYSNQDNIIFKVL